MFLLFDIFLHKLYGDSYDVSKFEDNQVPRYNFVDFHHAIILIFRILCGEWIESLWETMEGTGSTTPIFFYALVILVGNFIVLNLFLALLLSAFAFDAQEVGFRISLSPGWRPPSVALVP